MQKYTLFQSDMAGPVPRSDVAISIPGVGHQDADMINIVSRISNCQVGQDRLGGDRMLSTGTARNHPLFVL